jgi:hypothetical protein
MAVCRIVEIARRDRGVDRTLLAMALGLVFILVGVIVSLTIVGAIVGVPLAIIGLLLLLRGIF